MSDRTTDAGVSARKTMPETQTMHTARLILYHKQATSARTRFLLFSYGGVCAFDGLPERAELLAPDEEIAEKVALHPSALVAEAEEALGLPRGSIEADGGFRAYVDVADGPIEVYLGRFTQTDPPFDTAAAHGARFVDITQARRVPSVELLLLRRAYEQILG